MFQFNDAVRVVILINLILLDMMQSGQAWFLGTVTRTNVCVCEAHSHIYNPETKRMIKYNGPKWKEIMEGSGGFIVYDGRLCPIEIQQASNHLHSKLRTSTINLSDRRDHEIWILLEPHVSNYSFMVNDDLIILPPLDELLFTHKPSGLLTLPGVGPEKQYCLASAVNEWLNTEGQSLVIKAELSEKMGETKSQKKKQRFNSRGIFTPRPCHRLDYDTSGIVVVGLTRNALSLTSNLFEQKSIEKQYSALVWGHPREDKGTIKYAIGKIPSSNFNEFACYMENTCLVGNRFLKNITVDNFVDGSLRDAETDFVVTKRFTITSGSSVFKYSKIKLYPKTGRGHQLRLHCASINHPILGDILHAPTEVANATPRLCLHAEQLAMNVQLSATSEKFRIVVSAQPPF